MALTEEERRKVVALRDNFPYYAASLLKIRTKAGDVEPLVLNSAQKYIDQKLESQLKRIGRIRAIVLKGRQQGVSTYVEGRFYWRTTQRKGARTFILTHEQEATNNLFGITARYHAHMPTAFQPKLASSNAHEMVFDGMDSGYKVGTAGTKGVGRSATIQFFHGSEIGFWPHAETHLGGVLQAVPDEVGTEVVLESTANGAGGVFHQLWLDAEAGIGDYEPIFIPWFWQEEYKRTAPGFVPTAQEAILASAYSLSNEQLAWRRAKIAELKSEDLFKQEYPCSATEAFLFSGRPVFDRNLLMKAQKETFKPLYRTDIKGEKLDKRDSGLLRIWAEPKPGHRYVAGADVAEGLAHGDYSCAQVLDGVTGELVAQWHGREDPDKFGVTLAAIGKRYNKALIGVERNNHGLTTLVALRDTGYANIYAQEDIERRNEGTLTKKLGWLTTSKSKFKIIDQIAAALRDGDHGIWDSETIKEMQTYVIDDGGSYNAAPGYFDDRVMSLGIALEMFRHAYREPRAAVLTPRVGQVAADSVGGY